MLHFELEGYQYRFRIEKPTQKSLYEQWEADGVRSRGCRTTPRSRLSGAGAGGRTSCCRRRLEFAEGDATGYAADAVRGAHDGRTLEEAIRRRRVRR
jgi:hypothetical protein